MNTAASVTIVRMHDGSAVALRLAAEEGPAAAAAGRALALGDAALALRCSVHRRRAALRPKAGMPILRLGVRVRGGGCTPSKVVPGANSAEPTEVASAVDKDLKEAEGEASGNELGIGAQMLDADGGAWPGQSEGMAARVCNGSCVTSGKGGEVPVFLRLGEESPVRHHEQAASCQGSEASASLHPRAAHRDGLALECGDPAPDAPESKGSPPSDNAMLHVATTTQHAAAVSGEIIEVLSGFDDQLIAALKEGVIRIISCKWLHEQDADYRMERLQDLVKREKKGEQPFLSTSKAADLVRQQRRGLGVLSYGWLTPSHPDPWGTRLKAVRAALDEHGHIEGLFWDFASLPQWPRTDGENDTFSRALSIMGDLYASAVGTTVLRSDFIPDCPPHLLGVYNLYEIGTSSAEEATRTEDAVRAVVEQAFGAERIRDFKYSPGEESVVRLEQSLSDAEEQAALNHQELEGAKLRATAAYNKRAYDNRGWCFFESTVSTEVLARLNEKVAAALVNLKPKVLQVDANGKTCVVAREEIERRAKLKFEDEIKQRRFTGKGDHEKVAKLYDEYFERIAKRVASTLHISLAETDGRRSALPDAPEQDLPPERPVFFVEGQYLLSRATAAAPREAKHANLSLCTVTADGSAMRPIGTSNEEIPVEQRCHRALPWITPVAGEHHASPSVMTWLVKVLNVVEDRSKSIAAYDAGQVALQLDPSGTEDELKIVRAIRAAMTCLGDLERIESELRWLANPENDGTSVANDVGMRQGGDMENERKHQMAAMLQQLRDATDSASKLVASTKPVDGSEIVILSLEDARITMAEKVALALYLLSNMRHRRYATEQDLVVLLDGEWHDFRVHGHSGHEHLLVYGSSQGATRPVLLHPWNHAPLDLPLAAFEKLRICWEEWLEAQHSHIIDAISGRRLDVMKQCVPIVVEGIKEEMSHQSALHVSEELEDHSDLSGETDAVVAVGSLCKWVLHCYTSLSQTRGDMHTHPCLLITAGPAAGKTTLTSKLILELKATTLKGPSLVPILVRGQLWQRRLAEHHEIFDSAWNWVDAFVQVEYRTQPAIVRMLRQAMLSRRAVLILDGLDECGEFRCHFERHIRRTLVPQGHVIVALSRPNGLDDACFRAFRRASLQPLSEEQQRQVLKKRLPEAAADVWRYICDRLPLDGDNLRITSNPLMLSMLASIAEVRVGREMPKSVADLYQVATDAMLKRAKRQIDPTSEPTVRNLDKLLRLVFMHAHRVGRRVINSELITAAIGSDAPWLERQIRHDRVPLLSMLQTDPLEVQAPHLSFQEFMVALAIQDDATKLPVQSLEKLDAFWANVIRLGSGLGEQFGNAIGERLGLLLVEEIKVGEPANTVACCAALSAVMQSTSAKVKTLR